MLMAVHNGEDYLQEALDSLAAQTDKDFRLVVVDDGSADQTAGILAAENRLDVQLIRNEEKLGLTKSLNVGLEQCDSDWIMRMDADDVCVPERVAVQRSFIEQNPELVLFSSDMLLIDAENRPIGKFCFPSEDGAIRFDFLFANPFGHPSSCFRREALNKAGRLYDPSFRTSQDYELWSRLLDQGRVANQREILLRYRRHGETVNARNGQEQGVMIDKVRIAYAHKMAETVCQGDQRAVEAFVALMSGGCPAGAEGLKIARAGFEIFTNLADKWRVPRSSQEFCWRWKLICRSQSAWGKTCRIKATNWMGSASHIRTYASERWGAGRFKRCSIGWPFRGGEDNLQSSLESW